MKVRTTRLPAMLLFAALLPAFPLPAADNLLANGGFEEDEVGQLAMWSMDAFTRTNAAVRFFPTSQEKHSGNRALAIANLEPNDARAIQWVKVRPDTYYRLACWILTQGIETEEVGANISVLGITSAAGNLTDTAGEWVPVELYGRTGPAQLTLGVVVRVGFYGSLARGLALFDDVSLEELSGPPPIPPDKIVKLGSAEPQARIIQMELPSCQPDGRPAVGLPVCSRPWRWVSSWGRWSWRCSFCCGSRSPGGLQRKSAGPQAGRRSASRT